MISKKTKKLLLNHKPICLITTCQRPHLADYFLVGKYLNLDIDPVFIDLTASAPFRIDLPVGDNLKTTVSKLIRNSLVGRIKIIIQKQKFNFLSICQWDGGDRLLDDDELNVIFATYRSFYINKFLRGCIEFNPKLFNKLKQLYVFTRQVAHRISTQFDTETPIFLFNGRLPCEYFMLVHLKHYGFKNFIFLETNQFTNCSIIRDRPIHDLESYEREIKEYLVKNDNVFLFNQAGLLIAKWKNLFSSSNQENMFDTVKIDSNTVVFFQGSIDEYSFFYDDFPNQLFH